LKRGFSETFTNAALKKLPGQIFASGQPHDLERQAPLAKQPEM
jgi:hypothetical protein